MLNRQFTLQRFVFMPGEVRSWFGPYATCVFPKCCWPHTDIMWQPGELCRTAWILLSQGFTSVMLFQRWPFYSNGGDVFLTKTSLELKLSGYYKKSQHITHKSLTTVFRKSSPVAWKLCRFRTIGRPVRFPCQLPEPDMDVPSLHSSF